MLYTLFKHIVYVIDKILFVYEWIFFTFFFNRYIVRLFDSANDGNKIAMFVVLFILTAPIFLYIYVEKYTEYWWIARNVGFALTSYFVTGFLLWWVKGLLSPTEDGV